MGIVNSSKKIVVTGGTGLLARFVVREFVNNNYLVFPIVSNERIEFARNLFRDMSNVQITSNDYFFSNLNKEFLHDSFVINTAFTRKNDGQEIAKSLEYSFKLFDKCKRSNIAGIINCSSRSVYKEPNAGELNTENSPLDLDSLIASAKYGSELLLFSFFQDTDIKYTNLRIASLNEIKQDNNMVRPLNVFVENVINNESIKVYNGEQTMSFVDPRDVAKGIRMMCDSDKSWEHTYNIGAGLSCTMKLIEMAKMVVDIGLKLGYKKVNIEVIDKDIKQTSGMDISRINEDFGYYPDYTIEDMIIALFEIRRNDERL